MPAQGVRAQVFLGAVNALRTIAASIEHATYPDVAYEGLVQAQKS